MAGEQGDAPGRLKLDGVSPPTVQNGGGDGLRHFLVELLHLLERSCQRRRLGALNRLPFQQRGHGLVVLARAIQNARQGVGRTDASQNVSARSSPGDRGIGIPPR